MQREFLFDLLYQSGLARILRVLKRNHVTILNLHRISDDDDYFFNPLRPAEFEKLIRYVVKHYSVLSFSELSELKTSLKKPPLLLSFDDGYRDFYENALPILNKFNVPSNHNIVNECVNRGTPIWTHRLNTIFNHCMANKVGIRFKVGEAAVGLSDFDGNWMSFYLKVFRSLLGTAKSARMDLIGEKEQELSISTECRMMNWDEIVDCSANRVEIGSHTYSHDVISGIEDEDVLAFELVESKSEIEKKIGKSVSVLALPNGQGNERINEFVRRAGFRYLLYVNDGVNRWNNGPASIHVLDRINMVRESFGEMILRAEMFHSKLRKYV